MNGSRACRARQRKVRIACSWLAMMAWSSACGTSRRFDGDVVSDQDAGGLGLLDAGTQTQGAVFAPCTRDADCLEGLFCDEVIPSRVALEGLPGEMLDLALFPGGSCSPLPLAPHAPEDGVSCDPRVRGVASGCTESGVCVPEDLGDAVLVACRARCSPSNVESGCERPGYTCDFSTHACLEGCASDAECRIEVLDSNADGVADGVRYDGKSAAYCAATGRCSHPGADAGPTGAACTRLDACDPDGTCLRETTSISGLAFPGGYCTKLGCDVEGRHCDAQSVCAPLRPWSGGRATSPMCLTRCVVGAEPPAQRLGPQGHGAGCRTGYRCHYNGGMGAANGVCVGGSYNDIVDNNVGAACGRHSDCYSAFGYGRCLTLAIGGVVAPSGVCTLMDCNVPGLPAELCGTDNECMALGEGTDRAFCVHRCTAASDCAPGFACSDDDADPTTPTVCYPACAGDEECRSGTERCELRAGSNLGQCVASGAQGG